MAAELARGEGRVLVVAADEELVDLLLSTLTLAGYDASHEPSGQAAVARMRAEAIDLLVVDISTPGLVHIPRLKSAEREAAILFLATEERFTGLLDEVGFSGEDYLLRPFRVSDLLARVHLLVRDGVAAARRSVLERGELRIDDSSYRAWRGDRELGLSPAEYRLLREFARNPGLVLSKEQIAARVWGNSRDDNAIERLVSRLRSKVDREDPALIRTQRGFGYSLVRG
ncbi:DNA-binding response regulator, OmpR family, contains REC and winged-helix (wHTH) domain [Nocardioides sp. YR527]|uniref:response regulator transcription factor n=1 Tax=Nocardioides sp. YR527 TaxID=1881028 RepID=UPI00088E40C0|nr:response regulator transcription factor [Nocardioides sp. YR527]SDK48187.1 DNA-binding response regulator, OmpR family, contains REC and winged-helix (wHTH) domain [Nocardioides sp. YR527]